MAEYMCMHLNECCFCCVDVQPPGAIDNSQLLEDKNGTFVYNGGHKTTPTQCTTRVHILPGHPYRKLSREVWSYFVQLYGGGPTLMTCPPQSIQQ